MKIAILTPLFPPDTNVVATYAKLLSKRLKELSPHVVAYGLLPEKVEGSILHPLSKRAGKTKLVYRCLKELYSISPTTLIVLNGPSSDLPALLFSYLKKTPVIYIYSDLDSKAKYSPVTRLISNLLSKRAALTITLPNKTPTYILPEQLPFSTTNPQTEHVCKDWWEAHERNITEYVQ